MKLLNHHRNVQRKTLGALFTLIAEPQVELQAVFKNYFELLIALEMAIKNQLSIRYFVLFLTCSIMIGNYFCFDNPSALKSQLQSHFPHFTAPEFEYYFSLLYSIYSIPNIILPFLGGLLVDTYGVRIMMILFSLLILIGQIIFAYGASIRHFQCMLFGRFIFGLGGESLSVAQSTMVVSWFPPQEMALALGVNLSIARLGSVVNNIVSPRIANGSSVAQALWVGVFVCALSVLACVVLFPIDAAAEKQVKSTSSRQTEKKKGSWRDIKHLSGLFWLLTASCVVVYGCVLPFNNVASSLLLERDFFKMPPPECRRCGTGAYAAETNCLQLASHCPPVPPYAWPLPKLSSNCTITIAAEQYNCSTTAPFLEESGIECDSPAWKNGPFTKLYCHHKDAATNAAATPMSIPYLLSAILSPFLGGAVDRVGKRGWLALFAPSVLILVHLILGLTSLPPYFPLILQGVAYSVFSAALWPSVPCKNIKKCLF